MKRFDRDVHPELASTSRLLLLVVGTLSSFNLYAQSGKAEAYYHAGAKALERGDLDGAELQFRAALKLRSDFVEARQDLGITLARKGKLKEAAEQLQKVTEQRPESPDAHYDLGLVYFRDCILDFRKAYTYPIRLGEVCAMELWIFVQAVFAQWIAIVGILLAVIPFVPDKAQKWIESRIMKDKLSLKHLRFAGALLLVAAVYYTWRDEYRHSQQLMT